jgi:CheY-like chemotaxis protein
MHLEPRGQKRTTRNVGRIANPPYHRRDARVPDAATPAGRRILIVEDNADAADSLAQLLGLSGQEVRTARDGPRALEAARAFAPEVVLLDIGLPGMDGYELAPLLRQIPGVANALLVALTGNGEEDARRRALEAGFDAHVLKPADLDTLLGLLGAPATPPDCRADWQSALPPVPPAVRQAGPPHAHP